eukprot:6190717-Pleurochrysis_carterae.AAC.3
MMRLEDNVRPGRWVSNYRERSTVGETYLYTKGMKSWDKISCMKDMDTPIAGVLFRQGGWRFGGHHARLDVKTNGRFQLQRYTHESDAH